MRPLSSTQLQAHWTTSSLFTSTDTSPSLAVSPSDPWPKANVCGVLPVSETLALRASSLGRLLAPSSDLSLRVLEVLLRLRSEVPAPRLWAAASMSAIRAFSVLAILRFSRPSTSVSK
ncbi:unnamed protein product, partial [Ixodes pacificus]